MTDSKETINRRAMGLGLSLLLLRLPTHAQSTRTVRNVTPQLLATK